MTADLNRGIVRVVGPDGDTTGTGFVVTDDGLIATCAHVVWPADDRNKGLSRPEYVDVVFRSTGDRRRARVEPTWWRDADAQDVAILRIVGNLPEEIKSLLLGSSTGTSGHAFHTFGYPEVGKIDGIWGYGTVGGHTTEVGHNLLQLTCTREVTVGFSGGPVLDTDTRRVIGMVTSITRPDRYGRLTETAFITPTETLREICPELNLSDICPYKGLAAFTEDDVEFFFGREKLIAELIAKLKSSPRFLAVVGPSGSGKSSVVQAGLFPALRRGEIFGSKDWHLLTFRPGTDPFTALNAAGLSTDGELKITLRTFLDDHPDIERFILFVDQLEELFALCTESLQKRFLNNLVDLLESDSRVTVILTLRGDFYDHLLHYRPFKEYLDIGQVNVVSMGEEELRAAIQEPAKAVGLSFESGLVDIIVGEVSRLKHPLPLLEAALTQMWKQRDEGMLSHESYQRVGQVTGAISQWAEDTYSGLNEQEQVLAQRAFTRLIRYGKEEIPDTRQRQLLIELSIHPDEKEFVHGLVRLLADARLLVTNRNPLTGEETVEIIHDALLWEWGRLRKWIAQQREFLLWRQRLDERLRDWRTKERDEGALLRGAQLAEAEQWLSEQADYLNSLERRFVQESIVLREREQKAQDKLRRRIFTGLITGLVIALFLALLACGLAGLTGIQWQRAERESDEAEAAQIETERQARIGRARELAARAQIEDDSTGSLNLMLARESALTTWLTETSVITKPFVTNEALTALHYAIYKARQLPWRMTIPWRQHHTGSVNAVAYSPDGSHIVSGSSDQTVRIWDAETGQELSQLTGHTDEINAVAYSPDGGRIVSGSGGFAFTGSDDYTVQVWNAETGLKLTQLTGHTGDVYAVAYSPDGSRIVSGSFDQTVRIWDAETGRELSQLTGHTDGINAVAYSPDGKRIVSGSFDQTVRIWDAETGQELSRLTGHTDRALSVAYNPDASRIVSGGKDGTVRVWNAETGQELTQLTGHISDVYAVTYSPDGSRIVSGSSDQTVRIWDAETGRELSQLIGHSDGINAVAYSPDGSRVVSGSLDQTFRIWNAETGQELTQLTGRTGWVLSVAYSPDGRRIVSGSSKGMVWIWDAETGQELSLLTGHTGSVYAVTYSPDGERIVSGSYDQTVRVWDAKTGQELRQLIGHTGWVLSVDYSPDGRHIVSGDRDGTVRIWNGETGEELRQLTGHAWSIESVAFSPDGNCIVSGSSDSVRIWDVETGQELNQMPQGASTVAYSPDGSHIVSNERVWDAETGQELIHLIGHTRSVNSVAYSPDGSRIVSAGDDKTVREWDAETGEELTCFTGHTSGINSVAYSPDGSRIISGSDDQTVRVWNATASMAREQKQEMTQFADHTGWVLSVAYSPDGSHIVSSSADETIRVWDVETGQELNQLVGHIGNINAVVYSPDGERIVSAGADDTVRVWNVKSGQELNQLIGHAAAVNSVAYSPDGSRIVSGSDYGTARVWNAETGQEMIQLNGHTGWVLSVSYSPDGDHIVSGSGDHTVRIWDAETGQELTQLIDHTGPVESVAYNLDGSCIVSGGWDGTARVWDVETGQELTQFNGHTGRILSVAYSPDGRCIVSSSSDGTMQVWDAATGQELTRLTNPGSINSAAYSPNGNYIVSGSDDGVVRVRRIGVYAPSRSARDRAGLAQCTGYAGYAYIVEYNPNGQHTIIASDGKTEQMFLENVDYLLNLADCLIQRDPPIFQGDERTRLGFDERPALYH